MGGVMGSKWILWGLAAVMAGIFLWVVSIVFNIVTLGKLRVLSNAIAIITAGILPVVALLAFVTRKKK